MFFWTGDNFLTRCQLLENTAAYYFRKAWLNYNIIRPESFPYTKEDGLRCVCSARQRSEALAKAKTCPSSEQWGILELTPQHPPLPARLTPLSTSFVKGLLVLQLHHFFCSCGIGARKSWKVRALHVRCRGQGCSSCTFPFSAVSVAVGWELSQSDTEAGLVTLLFRFLS